MSDQQNEKQKNMPRWAQELLRQYPGAELPTAENPIPGWLEGAVKKTPFWYIIRSGEPRTAPPYLLIEELHKEPDQWQDILETMPSEVERVSKGIQEQDIQEIIFTGCGSSFFTAMHGELTFPALSGVRSFAMESFELEQYFPDVDEPHTLVVGHSGTGGSIEVRNGAKRARELGCHTLAFVNTEGSPLEEICEDTLIYPLPQGCGPCINVIGARILIQTMLGIAVGKARGWKQDFLLTLEKQLPQIPAVGQTFLNDYEQTLKSLAKKHKDTVSFFTVGSGPHYYSAREGALKMEEESICVNKAHRPGDYHHGILSILDPKHCTIASAAQRPSTNVRIVDCLRASKAAGTPTIAIVFRDDDPLIPFADDVVRFTGGLDEILTPIAVTLFFQMFGYYRGVERGYNPDVLRTDYWPNAKAWLTSFPLGDH